MKVQGTIYNVNNIASFKVSVKTDIRTSKYFYPEGELEVEIHIEVYFNNSTRIRFFGRRRHVSDYIKPDMDANTAFATYDTLLQDAYTYSLVIENELNKMINLKDFSMYPDIINDFHIDQSAYR